MESKHWKLKPYWRVWLKQLDKYRKDKTATQIINWDNIDWAFGGFSVTIPPETVPLFIKEDLVSIYHRNNLTLKIFFTRPITLKTTMDQYFGKNSTVSVVDTSKIQNFYAQEKLAPRVYDLVFLTNGVKKFVTQITDYIPGNFVCDEYSEEKIQTIIEFGKSNQIVAQDLVHSNFKQGLFVDFQQFYFRNDFQEKLIEKVTYGLGFGDDTPYQSVETLGITGKRNNWDRYKIFEKYLKKDIKTLPKNFTVLDFGCNGGFFLRRAFDLGAGYGVGFDTKEIIKVTEQIMIEAEYFKADFYDYLPKRQFDLVFYLSMDAHYPFGGIVPVVKDILYLEGHAGNGHDETKYRAMLKPHFKTVELLGSVDDCPKGEPRLLFRAQR